MLRNAIRAIIHGVLIESYHYQILSLAIIDVIFIVISFLFLRHFINKFLFFFFIAYQVFVLVMDCTFFIYQLKHTLFNENLYDEIVFSYICAIILSALLLSIAILISTVRQMLEKYTKIFKKSSK